MGRVCKYCRARSVTPAVLVPVGQFQAVRHTKNATLQQRFEDFHTANPWVYFALCALARDLLASGIKKMGIGMLFEVLRWHYTRVTRDPSGATFKLNNNYRSRYVRLIEAQELDLSGCFETRQLQTP